MDTELTGVPADVTAIGSVHIVSVFLSTLTPAVKKDFHCAKCGRICFNYYSDLRVIYDGEVGIQEYLKDPGMPHDIMCSRCHMLYRVS